MGEFSQRVIIITGAGGGIGKATAIKLSSLGATLALTDINLDVLQSTVEACGDSAAGHSTWTVDIRSTDACNKFVADVVAKHGALHGCFNCAGVNPAVMETHDISEEYWDKLINTNLKGTFNCTKACLPYLPSGTSIVNTSSMCGLYPTAGFAVYCASKYGVIGFSKCVALEVGGRGIRVNVIAPGSIRTPTNISVRTGGEQVDRIAEGIGLKRIGDPEEVAEVVAFLFSDKSRYMNGSVVEVDGGIGVAG